MEIALLRRIHLFCFLFGFRQGDGFRFFFDKGYRVFRACVDAFGIAAAEVADENEFFEYFDCADWAIYLAGSTEIAHGGGCDYFPVGAFGQCLFRTTEAVALAALNAGYGAVDAGFVYVGYFYPGKAVIYFTGMEKSTGGFAAPATGAFAQVNTDHW